MEMRRLLEGGALGRAGRVHFPGHLGMEEPVHLESQSATWDTCRGSPLRFPKHLPAIGRGCEHRILRLYNSEITLKNSRNNGCRRKQQPGQGEREPGAPGGDSRRTAMASASASRDWHSSGHTASGRNRTDVPVAACQVCSHVELKLPQPRLTGTHLSARCPASTPDGGRSHRHKDLPAQPRPLLATRVFSFPKLSFTQSHIN